MAQLTRHRMVQLLISAFDRVGIGMRDQTEGRTEPLSWFFRAAGYDQNELDLLGAAPAEAIDAPSALIELMVDEMALGLHNIGLDGLSSYIRTAEEEETAGDALEFQPEIMLGFLHIDVVPPEAWLKDRPADQGRSEALAAKLAKMAEDAQRHPGMVEIHMERAMDSSEGWSEGAHPMRAEGVSVHFCFEIMLEEDTLNEVVDVFQNAARVASSAVEGIREVFTGRGG
ncbi:MAG: hypothetical protein J4G03_05840 [Gemmatimonadetes bacterium]|nr:hypothetical protein [Gemmatimonadota bacterium]